MSLIIFVEPEFGMITRNGVTTYEPELWQQLKSFNPTELEDDEE